jgi:hypothetical protein
MTETNWFYEQNGSKKGPIPKDELAKLIIDETIDPDTLIWREGMPNWLKANETGEFGRGDGPPPLPISHVSSGFILLVSTLPIWMLFVQLIISLAIAGDNTRLGAQYYDHNAWIIVTMIINAFFCSIDSTKLKKIGVEVSYIWAIFIVPVYIYQRGSKLMKIYGGDFVKNQIFFFIWLGSFLISMFISVPLGMMMAIIK